MIDISADIVIFERFWLKSRSLTMINNQYTKSYETENC